MRSARVLLATLLAAAGLLLTAAPAGAAAPGVYGIDVNNVLSRFDPATPGTVTAIGGITGLASGESIVGMDFRPADAELYVLTFQGRIYRVDTSTAAATLVSTLVADPADTTSPFTGLSGGQFGVDFNPVVDRLRVTSDTEQNLRINVTTGATTTDGPIAYAGGDRFAGANPRVTAVAYSNNVQGTSSTSLFAIDAATNALALQSPPNDGTLQTRGLLGQNPTNLVGFDIGRGTSADTPAYAAYDVGDGDALYAIDTAAGASDTRATLVGAIGSDAKLVDIAVAFPTPTPVIPEVGAAVLLPLAGLGVLGLAAARRRAGRAMPLVG